MSRVIIPWHSRDTCCAGRLSQPVGGRQHLKALVAPLQNGSKGRWGGRTISPGVSACGVRLGHGPYGGRLASGRQLFLRQGTPPRTCWTAAVTGNLVDAAPLGDRGWIRSPPAKSRGHRSTGCGGSAFSSAHRSAMPPWPGSWSAASWNARPSNCYFLTAPVARSRRYPAADGGEYRQGAHQADEGAVQRRSGIESALP